MPKKLIDTRLHTYRGNKLPPGPTKKYAYRIGDVRLTAQQAEFMEHMKTYGVSGSELLRSALDEFIERHGGKFKWQRQQE